MKFLQKNVKLDGDYTNHSIRATVITNLDRDGFEGRHIIQLSSHKSENTIKEYSVRCPEIKRKQMFDSLSNAITPKRAKVPSFTVSKPPQSPTECDKTPENSGQQEAIVPQVSDVKKNLPSFDLFPIEDMATIDDNVLSDLLNNEFEHHDNSALVPVTTTQNAVNPAVPSTINTQVNTINVPQRSVNRMPVMYFPNSNVTINYNFSK